VFTNSTFPSGSTVISVLAATQPNVSFKFAVILFKFTVRHIPAA
jgi:hypothetical protein